MNNHSLLLFIFVTLRKDIKKENLEVAKSVGADETILITKESTPEQIADEIMKKLDGFADVTLECTGIEFCINVAILATASGGKIALVGLGPGKVNLPLSKASLKEIDLLGVCRYRNR